MDKIWYRNPSKVIGRCGVDEKTRMTTQNRQKSNAKKIRRKQSSVLVLQILNMCSDNHKPNWYVALWIDVLFREFDKEHTSFPCQ